MPSTSNNRRIQLKDVPLFRDLSVEERVKLKAYLREKAFAKGEILFQEGNGCHQIFIIREGRVKLFRLSASGREQILEVLEAGNTCACNPGSLKWSCSSSAEALTAVKVWILSRERYADLVKNNSHLARTLNCIFAERLCRFCSLIEEITLDNPNRRLAKFILEMINQNACSSSEGSYPSLSLTHEEIAQRLGLVRETVTRHLNQLKKQNLIDIQSRQIIIHDKEGLKKILG